MKKTSSIGLALALTIAAVPAARATGRLAQPGTMPVTLNGAPVALSGYEIAGSNYYKLRDLAYVLRETDSRFSVGFDGDAVTLTPGQPYIPVGGELETAGQTQAQAIPSDDVLRVDGAAVPMEAYTIGGYNYMKLRDLGEAVGLDVGFDENSRTVVLTTAAPVSDAEAVLALMNEARAAHGVGDLELDETLCEAAAIRADEIAELFSHTRPDGTDCFTVIQEVGITGGYSTLGENIAMGQRTPEEVMQDWMNSPGHRANILEPAFTAVGIAHSGSGWVQLFQG